MIRKKEEDFTPNYIYTNIYKYIDPIYIYIYPTAPRCYKYNNTATYLILFISMLHIYEVTFRNYEMYEEKSVRF